VTVLEDSGAQVEQLGHEVGPDSIYTYDPALVCDGGALLLRSGKAIRQPEAPAMGEWFERNGIPVLARLAGPELADGGDLLWLDSHTLVIGRGFRTNEAGAHAIKKALEPYVDSVHVVDLPIGQGADYCLHTLSVISMLDRDLAVVSLPLMPVHLYQLLRARGVELIEIDPGEWDSLAPNVLALGPRDVVMLSGNPKTAARLRSAGCRVQEIEGSDVAIKGSGGPTCLTLPLQRDAISAYRGQEA
jgi:N-dimethylarginine dimethylaminohydrolase